MKLTSTAKWIRCLSILFIAILLLRFNGTAFAQSGTVRGRLDRRDSYGKVYPAAHVAVTLSNNKMGRSSPAYTDVDGMYYLYRVPPGEYYLEIWIPNSRQPLVYKIQVYEQPYTDIFPIQIP